jgi:hypothetical protein
MRENLDAPADQRVLLRAAEALGGIDALAHRLGAPMSDTLAWLCGLGRPPTTAVSEAIRVLGEQPDMYRRAAASDIDRRLRPDLRAGP